MAEPRSSSFSALGDLFQFGKFELHSGMQSMFKIDCDALTDNDIRAIAKLVATNLGYFSAVEGVPTGGLRLADAIRPYTGSRVGPLLIVDDVLTTGASMEEQRAGRDARGFVIFARGECPYWVTTLFQGREI